MLLCFDTNNLFTEIKIVTMECHGVCVHPLDKMYIVHMLSCIQCITLLF